MYDRERRRASSKEYEERRNSVLLRILEEEATGDGTRAPENR